MNKIVNRVVHYTGDWLELSRRAREMNRSAVWASAAIDLSSLRLVPFE